MLSLEDPRWKELDHRGWVGGAQHSADQDAPYVPNELRALAQTPTDLRRLSALSSYLCSEETAWPASHAVVPHFVYLAAGLPLAQRHEYLIRVGLIVYCTTQEEIKPYLVNDYLASIPTALSLLTETLCLHHNRSDTRYILAATAVLKGHLPLGEILFDLDSFSECPACEAEVFGYEE